VNKQLVQNIGLKCSRVPAQIIGEALWIPMPLLTIFWDCTKRVSASR